MKISEDHVTYHFIIHGIVQGVGFRPFVYRSAHKFGLTGFVKNTSSAIEIEVSGQQKVIDAFISNLNKYAPTNSKIRKISAEQLSIHHEFQNFDIIPSSISSERNIDISSDLAVCDDCLEDIKLQLNRIDYPFTNCTNCGPRFSITTEMPYDRPNTTMASFVMCPTCKMEYEDPTDRRFHAQPIACNTCGPTYVMHYGEHVFQDFDDIFTEFGQIIDDGGIIAVKGLGGYFLTCDATNTQAVNTLRTRKKRHHKPFAIMFQDRKALENYCTFSPKELKLIQRITSPVVLLQSKGLLPDNISSGLGTIGAILPYMPFHYSMFHHFKSNAVIFTSGNISDEPIITDDEVALNTLGCIADATLSYNREIYNRIDDSVQFIANDMPRFIRRSRGYVPECIDTNLPIHHILACGAELNNTFAIGIENHAIISQHIGDLKELENFNFYTEAIEKFKTLYQFTPTKLACDLHPDYFSTKFAERLRLPIVQIQHHHAHIASCMAEHQINVPVLGVCLDGTGLGTDGHVWGGEFLYCTYSGFERLSHFEYIPIPGGDKANYENWRTGLAYLYHYFGDEIHKIKIPFVDKYCEHLSLICQVINKKINTPLSDSCGRLFDAVAAITGVCDEQHYQAEAPMLLESIVDESIDEGYDFATNESIISFKPMFRQILADIEKGISSSIISTKFHNTLINIIFSKSQELLNSKSINYVALSGGCFQNKYLLEKTEQLFRSNSINCISNLKVPCNDGGIALGQLAIASKLSICV